MPRKPARPERVSRRWSAPGCATAERGGRFPTPRGGPVRPGWMSLSPRPRYNETVHCRVCIAGGAGRVYIGTTPIPTLVSNGQRNVNDDCTRPTEGHARAPRGDLAYRTDCDPCLYREYVGDPAPRRPMPGVLSALDSRQKAA